MERLPLELQHSVANRLGIRDFSNYAACIQKARRSCRPLTIMRMQDLIQEFNRCCACPDPCSSRSCKIKESDILHEFEILFLLVEGLERWYYWSDDDFTSIWDITNAFKNMLSMPFFIRWHRTQYHGWRAVSQLRMGHRGECQCGSCIASYGISRREHDFQPFSTGGWPVIREEANGTATYIDTVQTQSLTTANFQTYADDLGLGVYHVIAPYNGTSNARKLMNMPVTLDSSLREMVIQTAYRRASASLDTIL